MGWFGMLFVFAIIGFAAIIGVKTLPLYLNQMKVASAIAKLVQDPENSNADPASIRSQLQRFWDIDDVQHLSVTDVKIKRTDAGRFISYDYEARTQLFYNISIVVHFADDVPLANVQS